MIDALKAQWKGDRLMKKNSTVAIRRKQIFKRKTLTIGMDFGGSIYLLLHSGRSRRSDGRTKAADNQASDEARVRRNAEQPRGSGNRSPFPLGQPAVDPVGT